MHIFTVVYLSEGTKNMRTNTFVHILNAFTRTRGFVSVCVNITYMHPYACKSSCKNNNK